MSFVETYANNATTTLSGAITSGAASLVVNSASGFPLSPQFRLLIDTEYLQVTNVAGTSFTVTRGVEGSTAAAHSNSATVSQVLTSGGLIGVAGSVVLSDTVANLPATGVVGRLFFPSDDSYLYREGTTGWAAFGPIYPMAAPPALSSWTQVNFGTGSTSGRAVQNGSVIHLTAPATAGNARRILAMTAPVTGYTITAVLFPEIWMQQFPSIGVGWRDSSSDKQVLFAWHGDTGTTSFRTIYSAGSNTFYNADGTIFQGKDACLLWLQLQHDGVNKTVRYSFNGFDFTQLYQRAYNYYDGVTTMNPDQVMFFAESINTTYSAALTLYSWKITQP